MSVIYILWLRQIKRYMRSRSRVLGAIGQPLLFLLALGYGLGAVFKRAGQGNYLQFLVPGIIAQTILFSAVFWGIQIIWDKQFGFLKETLVAPVSRLKIMFGSALGGATIALFQGILVLFIAVILGFRPHFLGIPEALVIMAGLSIALAAFGSGIASIVNDFQGFQAINQFIIFPLYFLSGAIYPLVGIPVALRLISEVNPLSYTIDGLRSVLIGTPAHFGTTLDLLVITVTAVVLVGFGAVTFRRIQS